MEGGAVAADLLARAQGGDGDAFGQLVEPYRRELQVYCYRFLGSVADAEDALQDTLLSAWQALPGRQQGVLERILGVGHRAEKPVAVHLQLAPVRVDKLAERVPVSGLCPGEQVRCHRATLPRSSSGPAATGPIERPNTDDGAAGNWAPASRPVPAAGRRLNQQYRSSASQ